MCKCYTARNLMTQLYSWLQYLYLKVCKRCTLYHACSYTRIKNSCSLSALIIYLKKVSHTQDLMVHAPIKVTMYVYVHNSSIWTAAKSNLCELFKCMAKPCSLKLSRTKIFMDCWNSLKSNFWDNNSSTDMHSYIVRRIKVLWVLHKSWNPQKF